MKIQKIAPNRPPSPGNSAQIQENSDIFEQWLTVERKISRYFDRQGWLTHTARVEGPSVSVQTDGGGTRAFAVIDAPEAAVLKD